MLLEVFVKVEPFLSFDEVLSGIGEESAEIVAEKIVELMREPKTGKPYRHKDGTIRPASAPGEAPGIDSMDLVGSFDAIALSPLEGQVYSDIWYGTELQEDRNRPFSEPAAEAAEPEIVDLVERKIEDGWR